MHLFHYENLNVLIIIVYSIKTYGVIIIYVYSGLIAAILPQKSYQKFKKRNTM